MNSVPTPSHIYCPKCGKSMKMKVVEDAKTVLKLKEANYVSGARGMCDCGVVAILCMKALPENPTFTLMFNIYKLEHKKRG